MYHFAKNTRRTATLAAVAGVLLAGIHLPASADGQHQAAAGHQKMMAPPMGSQQDIADAKQLWAALQKAGLVGPGAVKLKPYKGTPPHGAVLETTHQPIRAGGHTGLAIVKRNYRGPDVSVSKVEANRAKYLKSVTVMYKREAGYDPDNKDWFWAKYKPDGALHTNPKGIQLAGRVAKGMKKGCIACHRSAPGGDYVFAPAIKP